MRKENVEHFEKIFLKYGTEHRKKYTIQKGRFLYLSRQPSIQYISDQANTHPQ